jgi:hypothetical protein
MRVYHHTHEQDCGLLALTIPCDFHDITRFDSGPEFMPAW